MTAQLLVHMIKTRDVTVPPHVVVVSILLYRWGYQRRTPGSDKSIHAIEWQTPRKPNRNPKTRERREPQTPNTKSPTTNKRISRGVTRGSERLTKEVPWLVPPWVHLSIETSGKDNLTETAPWMVPPWRWKTKKNEAEKDFKRYQPGNDQPTLHRWLVRKEG